jgi:hypothetical protein
LVLNQFYLGIRTFLLESEEHECPDCSEKDVSPESLIPNRYLRNAVLNFKNETGYAKRPTYKPLVSQKLTPTLVLSSEPTISEKLTASPTMSAATPTQAGPIATTGRNSSQGVTSAEAEVKEADKPIGKASPSYEKATLTAGSFKFFLLFLFLAVSRESIYSFLPNISIP